MVVCPRLAAQKGDVVTMDQDWLAEWQIPHDIVACEQCDALFLIPSEGTAPLCPLCGGEAFTQLSSLDGESNHTPELVVPFARDDFRFRASLIQFRKSLLLPPSDCTVDNLMARAQRFYWPMWLVDTDVTAHWQAEIGYEYDAITYGERYTDAGWQSTQERERRTRWEPRVGELRRTYENQPAPALDEHAHIERLLGPYRLAEARPYTPDAVAHNLIRLPTRTPDDAWSDAQLVVQQSAAAECARAANGQHARTYKWSPHYENQNWTHLLLPMLSTYYLDDAGQKQMVYLHGQTGRLAGRRSASMKRARQISLGIGAVALLLLGITALLWLLAFSDPSPISPDLLAFLTFLTMCAVVATAVPPLLVLYKNSFHFLTENESLERLR